MLTVLTLPDQSIKCYCAFSTTGIRTTAYYYNSSTTKAVIIMCQIVLPTKRNTGKQKIQVISWPDILLFLIYTQ